MDRLNEHVVFFYQLPEKEYDKIKTYNFNPLSKNKIHKRGIRWWKNKKIKNGTGFRG